MCVYSCLPPGGGTGRVPVPGGGVGPPVLAAVRGEQLQRGDHAHHRAARAPAAPQEAEDVRGPAPTAAAHRPAADGDGLPEETRGGRAEDPVWHHRLRSPWYTYVIIIIITLFV